MNICQQTKKEYSNLKNLKKEFEAALHDLVNSDNPDTEEFKRIKRNLEQEKNKLYEKLTESFYYPRELKRVERKENYENIETLEGHGGLVATLQTLPDGRIVSGGSDGTVRIWERNEKGEYENTETLEGHGGYRYPESYFPLLTLQALPGGRIVSGGSDGTVRIWERNEKGEYENTETLEGHRASVQTLQALPGGRIVSGGWDSTIRIWERNEEEGHKNTEILDHESLVQTLQVLPDGRIVSGGYDSTIRIWERNEKGKYENTETLEGHKNVVQTLQVLPDGRIVSGGYDGTIRIWERNEEGEYKNTETLEGHRGSVDTLQVLPDGRIVSGSGNDGTISGNDGTIRIWERNEEGEYENTETLEGHESSVATLQALPDGRIISGGADKTIRIWDGDKAE